MAEITHMWRVIVFLYLSLLSGNSTGNKIIQVSICILFILISFLFYFLFSPVSYTEILIYFFIIELILFYETLLLFTEEKIKIIKFKFQGTDVFLYIQFVSPSLYSIISRIFCFPFSAFFLRLSVGTGVTFLKGLMIMTALRKVFSGLKPFPDFHSSLRCIYPNCDYESDFDASLSCLPQCWLSKHSPCTVGDKEVWKSVLAFFQTCCISLHLALHWYQVSSKLSLILPPLFAPAVNQACVITLCHSPGCIANWGHIAILACPVFYSHPVQCPLWFPQDDSALRCRPQASPG